MRSIPLDPGCASAFAVRRGDSFRPADFAQPGVDAFREPLVGGRAGMRVARIYRERSRIGGAPVCVHQREYRLSEGEELVAEDLAVSIGCVPHDDPGEFEPGAVGFSRKLLDPEPPYFVSPPCIDAP